MPSTTQYPKDSPCPIPNKPTSHQGQQTLSTLHKTKVSPQTPKTHINWGTPFHCSGPGHCCLEASFPQLTQYYRQHVWDIHHQDQSLCSPIQHTQRKVPIEYWEQIEHTLNDMVNKGVTAPVSWPTMWVLSLTYPHKSDGTLCICLNPKDLNKAIVWEHYKAPTLDKISHWLSGTTYFSKLDAKDGFWSIHLDERSSYLMTFNTPHGRYHFLHMPFALKMSCDIFQICMDQVTDQLPSIITIHDDVCIYGHTPEKLDQHLLQLMKTAKQHGIVFNSFKCQIRQPRLPSMVQFSLHKACSLIPTKSKPSKTSPHPMPL